MPNDSSSNDAAPPLVTVATDGGIAVVTMNDPARRNVVTGELNDALVAAVDTLEDDPAIKAMVITGAPPAFCAGGHLDDLLNNEDADSMRAIYRGFLRVAESKLATLAAVNGAAVGAGMNMALACDVIVAGESARFDSRFLQIAIHPGGGHSWRLRHATSAQVARAMLLFGEVLDGAEAERVGLAWKCVPDDQLLTVATDMAARAAKAPKALIERTKDTIAQGYAVTSAADAVDLEIEPQIWSTQQSDFTDFVADLQARIAAKKAKKAEAGK